MDEYPILRFGGKEGEVCTMTDEELMRELAEAKKDGVYILDPDGELVVRTECFCREGHQEICSIPNCPSDRRNHKVCQGQGWIPSTDPWLYISAAKAAYPHLGDTYSFLRESLATALVDWTWYSSDADPGPAALRAVADIVLEKETP